MVGLRERVHLRRHASGGREVVETCARVRTPEDFPPLHRPSNNIPGNRLRAKYLDLTIGHAYRLSYDRGSRFWGCIDSQFQLRSTRVRVARAALKHSQA